MRLCRVYVQQSLEIDGTKVKVNTQEDNSREEQRGYTAFFTTFNQTIWDDTYESWKFVLRLSTAE